MEPIKKDNEKIEEIKDIEKNGMRALSEEELDQVAGGREWILVNRNVESTLAPALNQYA